MAQMIPMLMNPETRKASSNVGKILLVFGVLGVGIVAFIFLSKMFKPLEAVGKFFSNMFKGVGGFFKGALSGLGGMFSGVAGMFGIKSKGDFTARFEGDTLKRQKHAQDVQEWYGEENEEVRREFRRYSKEVIRVLEVLKSTEGVPREMAKRISMVQSAFKKVNKTFVRDLPKQFDNVWNRKVEFLEGNLIGGFRAEEIEKVARAVYEETGSGYAYKVAMAEKYEDRYRL